MMRDSNSAMTLLEVVPAWYAKDGAHPLQSNE